jgi:protein-tyrosine phosphatase
MQRVIALEGCLNFRDLGGYPAADGARVRWRRMFRSDALCALTPADVGRLRDEIGLSTVVDLRSTAELRADGDGPLRRAGLAHHHLPLFDGDAVRPEDVTVPVTLADRYWLLAEYAKARIASVLTALAGGGGAGGCPSAAGQDRPPGI